MKSDVTVSRGEDSSEQRITSFEKAVSEIFSDTNFNIKLFTELVGVPDFLKIAELLEEETNRLFDNMLISELLEFLSKSEEGANKLKKVVITRSIKSQQAEKLIKEAYAFYYEAIDLE